MIQNIEELIRHITRILPQSNAIRRLAPDPGGQYLLFQWNGREFVVKKSFETFELKDQRLFTTGASILMQEAPSYRCKNQKALETCISAIAQVEGLLSTEEQVTKGLKLLSNVKATLVGLCPRKLRVQQTNDHAVQAA